MKKDALCTAPPMVNTTPPIIIVIFLPIKSEIAGEKKGKKKETNVRLISSMEQRACCNSVHLVHRDRQTDRQTGRQTDRQTVNQQPGQQKRRKVVKGVVYRKSVVHRRLKGLNHTTSNLGESGDMLLS